MTKQCKYVLKHLKKLACNSDMLLSFLGNTTYICRFDDESTIFDYSKYEAEIDSIIQSLIDNGYLVQGFNQYHFHLTQKAIHHTQYSMEKIIKFLICSIVVPMAVSLATSIIVLYIQGLL